MDDERSVLEVTSRILRRNGYATLEAATWEEALSLASSASLTPADRFGDAGNVRQALPTGSVRPGPAAVLRMSGTPAVAEPAANSVEAAFLHKPFTATRCCEGARGAGFPAEG